MLMLSGVIRLCLPYQFIPMLSNSCAESSQCPFCQKEFVGLGNHLSWFSLRGNTDYRQFLSVSSKQSGVHLRKQQCHRCGKLFKHLDTHFRVSAACKESVSVFSSKKLESSMHPRDPPELCGRSSCATAHKLQGEGLADEITTTPLAQPQPIDKPLSSALISLKRFKCPSSSEE